MFCLFILGMIEAIKLFDEQRGDGVNMRVGVHTGTVLCGIVGTRRFKFDVWSNDVTLANRMESTGKPGRVHISEETSRFLTDYILEEGEDVFGEFLSIPKAVPFRAVLRYKHNSAHGGSWEVSRVILILCRKCFILGDCLLCINQNFAIYMQN